MRMSAADAKELAYGGDFSAEGLTIESDEQEGTTRWGIVHRLVIKDRDGKLWMTRYETGATEMQDFGPFEDVDEVEFTEVRKVPVTTYTYEPVK